MKKPSRLTLGTAQLGMPYGIANRRGQPSLKEVHAILKLALESGVRSFDTASVYGDAEERLGNFFQVNGWPEDLVMITKLPALHETQVSIRELPSVVEARMEQSLTRLKTDRIDYYLLHSCDDLRVYGDALVHVLERFVRGGVVGRLGVSIYTPADAAFVMRYPIFRAIQFPFNLIDQRMETSGTLQKLKEHGFTTFSRSTFLQGVYALDPGELPSKFKRLETIISRLCTLLERYKLHPLEAALPFVASVGHIDSVVIGVDTSEQLMANIARLKCFIPRELITELQANFASVEDVVVNPSRWLEPEVVS